jgi:hypothetical protein
MIGFLKEEVLNKRSQDLPKYYRINGAIYICKTDKLLEEKSFFLKENIFAYVMDKESSVDIDTKRDFLFAEFIMTYDSGLKRKITEEIFNSYTRQGFGRLLKAEIDLIMFDFSLKLFLLEKKPEYFIDDKLNYFAIDKQDIYELSKFLKITENKVRGYIEQLGLLKGLLDDEIGLKCFKSILLKQKQSRKNLSEGYIVLNVSNKLLKQFIEAKAYSLGKTVEYGENKELIKLDFSVLFQIFDITIEEYKRFVQSNMDVFNSDELNKLMADLNKKNFSIKDLSIEASKIILSSLIGKSGELMVEKISELLKNKMN